MDPLKTIRIIHASDADQHLGHLKKILDELKSEKRIDSYVALESETINENSLASMGAGDMVITLLTNGIEPVKALVEETMHQAKMRLPELKAGEIIIDPLPYDNQFIAFPSDLRPIRSREDMDGVWKQIGATLKEIFPQQEEPAPIVKPVPWKKYLPYVLGALALLLLFWLIPPIGGDDEDELKILSLNTSVTPVEGAEDECPKQFDFQGSIKVNGPLDVVYTWLRSDGTGTSVDTLKFETAGEKQISSSWTLGSDKKKYEEWQQLKIISPIDTVSNQASFTFECKGKGPATDTSNEIPTLNAVTAAAEITGDARASIDCGRTHRFSFSGVVKTNGKGKVNYAWVGNDGNASPVQTLVFQNAGSQRVSYTKTLRASDENGYEGWQQLKIISPTESYSGVAKFVLFCKKKEVTVAAQLKILSLSPGSPRTLKPGERVNFKFAYQTKWPGKVRVFGRPMTGGQVSKGYAAHGSKELPGSGSTESGYFTIKTSGATVDQIRFQIWDADQKKLINETFVPVNYKFTRSVVDVVHTPAPARTEGSFVVKQTWSGDFDKGRQVPRGSPASEKDFWFNARTATNRAIVPKNGALLSIIKNNSNPSRVQVITAIKDGTEKEIDVNKLVPGVWVAVKTGAGRYAAFTTVKKVGPSPGELSLKFRRW